MTVLTNLLFLAIYAYVINLPSQNGIEYFLSLWAFGFLVEEAVKVSISNLLCWYVLVDEP
jgi:hypothetical protein